MVFSSIPIPPTLDTDIETKETVVFFDFDDTLIPGDSILYWKRFYFQQKPLKRFFQIATWVGVLAYLLRLIDSKVLKCMFLLPISYETSKEEVDRLAKKFVLEELKPRLYPEMLQRLKDHQNLGHKIVIISASATFYLKHLRELFPNTMIIGTPIYFPGNGFFRFPRYDKELGNLKGITKVHYIQKEKGLPNTGEGCYGYSDGYTDRFLLEFTEYPFAVQPDRKMEQIAKEKGWPILRPTFSQSRSRRNFEKLKTMITDLGRWPNTVLFK
jgi:HAD superfamily hydrolase (TIGR01490 family)